MYGAANPKFAKLWPSWLWCEALHIQLQRKLFPSAHGRTCWQHPGFHARGPRNRLVVIKFPAATPVVYWDCGQD
eukprot:9145216-Alexandrium_andersonii.AAC.1